MAAALWSFLVISSQILLAASVGTEENNSSISSSQTRVTFIKSRTLIEVKEGQDAVLECVVRNLASHHTVGDFLFCFFFSSDASIRTGQSIHSLKSNNPPVADSSC